MNIRLFPDQFLQRDECFGLFKLGDGGELDLPVTVEGDAGIPFHIVHSDPDHLAYLTGLIVLQAWTSGIDELGILPTERRPVYEKAVDFLCSHAGYRPKIVASTATIRRYQDQIRGLFDREACQFPPPGLIAGESFFAAENKARPGRIYVGLCAPGKSMKTVAVRALASMMQG